MNRIKTLIIKELLAVLRDRKSRLAILAPPFIQLFIFAFAATLDVKNASIAILNRDGGKEAFELTMRFEGSPIFGKITHLHAVEEIAPFIEHQKGIMVLSIDEQFSRLLRAKKPAAVQLIFDGRKSNTAQILEGYTQTILNEYNKEMAVKMDIRSEKVQLVSRNWFNPNLLYFWYNFPSLVATLSMIGCLVVTSQSISRERELGTFDQLLVSPLSPFEMVIGKVVPGILVGLLEGTLMMACATLIFQVPFTGSLLLFYLSLFLFVSAISGVGLFISSLSATQQQATLGNFVFLMPSILLAGFATPIENMPTWLQPVTYIIPLRYMLIIAKGIFLKALPASIAWSNMWQIALIACVNLLGAGLFFRKRIL